MRLQAGERWTYQPPQGHDVAWVASHQGVVATPERVSKGEVVVFGEGGQAISFEALSDAGFILGSAIKHPYDLVTGYYSVHTSAKALRLGENNIAEIGRRLQDQGSCRRGGCPQTDSIRATRSGRNN